MTERIVMRITLCSALALVSACGTQTLTVKAPATRNGGITMPPLPLMAPSVVDAPISYALEPALTALEKSVPTKFGDIEHRMTIASNSRQQVAFEATRTPFRVAFDGKQVTLVSTVSYQGRGWYKPPLSPAVSASCGTGGEQPRLRIVLAIDVNLTREWALKSRTRLTTVRPETDTERDACKVTVFKLDVTDRVVDALRPQLEQQLPGVDRRIASFDLRSRMDRWYNLLNKSIHVHDSLWLVLAPQAVRLGGIRLADSNLVADVRLYAQPYLVSGPRPAPFRTALPPLERAVRTVGDSARLRLEGLLSYDIASDMLTRQLVGRTVRRYGRSIKLSRIRVSSLGDGRLVLAVGVTGDIVGDAYLVGTPHLDTLTHTLTVPDLDFDVATADALVRGLAWLRKADLVSQLRERAILPLDPLIDATRALVERALNRDLAPGVRLEGRVRTGRLVDVSVQPRWLVVRAEAYGALGLQLDREIEVPRSRRVTADTTKAAAKDSAKAATKAATKTAPKDSTRKH